jgi:predicted deacetylase
MSAPLPRLTWAALDALPRALDAFVRDDDGGWADALLLRLLDVCARTGMPIDLALIPQAMHEPLLAELRQRIDRLGQRIGLHQHGFAHANHEPQGRKCEFGPSRSPADQWSDLTQGMQRLQAALAHRLDAIFTPPWNRCTPVTAGLLRELGFQALSREHRAAPLSELPCLDVHVDWSRHGREGGANALDRAMAEAVVHCGQTQQALGLMLHHGAMADPDFDLLETWLTQLSVHPRLNWCRMSELLAPTALRAPVPAADVSHRRHPRAITP